MFLETLNRIFLGYLIKHRVTIIVITCLVFAIVHSLTGDNSENLPDQQKSEVLNMNNELYTMLIPILKVKDLDAEVTFYLSLGFELSYDGEDFKGIKYADCIEFGLGRKTDINVEEVSRHFTWQIAVNGVQEVLDMCREKNIKIVQDLKKYTYDFGDVYTIIVKSPNGYDVVFEGDL